jgi:hypothetical protein
MSGSPDRDILMGPLDFAKWTSHPEQAIPEEKQLSLLSQLRRWLTDHALRSDVDLPTDISEDAAKCARLDCDRRKLRASAYCRYHFDLACLRR